MSVLTDALSAIGLHPDILLAIGRAEVDPSSANINAVVRAYALQGQTPPPRIMAQLIARNRELRPDDPYSSFVLGEVLPWLLLAGAAWFVLRK